MKSLFFKPFTRSYHRRILFTDFSSQARSCGVLDDDNVKDKLIIPVSAVRDEGTSYHYTAPSPEIEADPRSVKNTKHNTAYYAQTPH